MMLIVGGGVAVVCLIALVWFAYTLSSIRESLVVIRIEAENQSDYLAKIKKNLGIEVWSEPSPVARRR